MSETPETSFSPIFLVGNERSGTTMLAGLFDRHSQVAATPETHLFYDLTQSQLTNRQAGNHEALVDLAFSQERVRDMELDRDEVLTKFRDERADLPNLFRVILERYAAKQGKPRVAEKSPHHILNVPTILDWYPEARIVCIVRDGRDAVLSLLQVPWAHNDVWLHSAIWRRLAKLGIRLQDEFPQQFTTVRFEDLLQRPQEELTRLMQFVGLDFEEQQLDPSVGTSVVPEWESDWKAKVNQALDPSRCHAWQHTAPKEQVWQMNAVMGPYLKHFDYPNPGTTDCPLAIRTKNLTIATLYRIAYGPTLNPMLKGIKSALTHLGLPENWRELFHKQRNTK